MPSEKKQPKESHGGSKIVVLKQQQIPQQLAKQVQGQKLTKRTGTLQIVKQIQQENPAIAQSKHQEVKVQSLPPSKQPVKPQSQKTSVTTKQVCITFLFLGHFY